ncbi:MAG: hypothetical protein HGA36_05145 [Candidatus Moranbacteria bacterium]|nr:hypothetical protein [Candidatus Moranbacteria bacterium]
MKKLIMLVAILGIFSFGYVSAQQDVAANQPSLMVDYIDEVPVDSDLDGLTDQAEIQIYHTDSKNPDTDSDGYYDGTEILSVADPLDADSIPGMPPMSDLSTSATQETPWAWYVSRVSGLVGFILLYISIFLALTIRVPFLRKLFSPLYALNAHGWIALQATIFAFIHGTVLIFDKFMGFNLFDVFVPFAANYERTLVAFGTISFYLMVILVVTSYARKYLSFKIWRAVHFLNIVLYFATIMHALYLGTDLKISLVRNIFIIANVFLIALMLVNMFILIRQNIARKNAVVPNPKQIQ